LPPTFMPTIPSCQPWMIASLPRTKSKGSPRSSELSKVSPLRKVPV